MYIVYDKISAFYKKDYSDACHGRSLLTCVPPHKPCLSTNFAEMVILWRVKEGPIFSFLSKSHFLCELVFGEISEKGSAHTM